MEVMAKSKYIGIPATKARLVADMIRGRKAGEALDILKFTPRVGARFIHKTVASAVANAEQRADIDVDTLFVKTIFVDEGPMLKRWMPKAMGRATKILKRSCHITVILAEA